MPISKRVRDRITVNLKRYKGILADAKNRDINESDTAVIIGDLLSDVLGYEKYSEITTEFAVRGTYVDLAVRVGSDTRFLVETKAVGVALKDNHVRQAIDYGANHGVEWIVLTTGIVWRIYKILFQQPVEKSLIMEIDLLNDSLRDAHVIECFGNLSREGFTLSSMNALYQRQQATNKFSLAALLLTEPLIKCLRREIRRCYPKIKVRPDFLREVLTNEVLKREVVDSEESHEAVQLVRRAKRANQREKARQGSAATVPDGHQANTMAASAGGDSKPS